MTTNHNDPGLSTLEFARDRGWTITRIHDQQTYNAYRRNAESEGISTLLAYYSDDDEMGKAEILAIDLDVDASYSFVRGDQESWPADYGTFLKRMVALKSNQASRVKSIPNMIPNSPDQLPQYFGVIVEGLRQKIKGRDMPKSTIAELKRMDSENPLCPAYYRLAAPAQLGKIGGVDAEAKWGCILQGMAILSNMSNDKPISLGAALYTGGNPNRRAPFYSEHRLNGLIASRGNIMRTLLRRVFYMLANARQSIYWRQVSELVVADGYDNAHADSVRERIANSYFTAMHMSSRDEE